MTSIPQLTDEQKAALTTIEDWLADKDGGSFFVLKGGAGTGKTFCIRQLIAKHKGRIVFTAPTNKAVKVLRDSLTTDDYKPECMTTFSLLGLTMSANGEVKELSAREDPIDLSHYRIVVVDEGSMVSKILMKHIEVNAGQYKLRVIFMGDNAQLPPVKEDESPIWKIAKQVELKTVMRHDNQVLNLVTSIRSKVFQLAPKLVMEADNDGDQGVFRNQVGWKERILDYADSGSFLIAGDTKAIAWRNVTVDSLNKLIRSRLFPGAVAPWVEGDRVTFLAPAKDLEDEPMATTDDEGTVDQVTVEMHPLYPEFKVYRLSITLDNNKLAVALVLHPEETMRFAREVEDLATRAKAMRKEWRKYWDFKEAFHSVRHGYAITAHRAQGSTYNNVFVDWRDILINQNRRESLQCLYVACSRPKYRLFLN